MRIDRSMAQGFGFVLAARERRNARAHVELARERDRAGRCVGPGSLRVRRSVRAGWIVLALLSGVIARQTHAEQRRDWMFQVQEPGDVLLLDFFGTGSQFGFEHRGNIYGSANDYAFNVSTLLGYPVGQVTGTARLRVLFLEFSLMAGYRTVWRNLSFEPGRDGEYCRKCDRGSRRDRDPVLGHGPDTDHFPMFEAATQLFFPFNDNLVFVSLLAARYEGVRPRSYDWFFTNIHDDGVMIRSESLLFFKHRDWGGFAPYLQLMSLPRAGQHDVEVAWGFNAVTRLGLIERNDLLFATFLIRPGDDYYGQHAYFSPVRALLIYRMLIDL